mmetsp:Transcript_4621/g.13331  ORF Transcript_4621/g.13331 Transcript_4621/m.13331 type:complete len:237 (-) Transcript_4621:663-1373(-)
MRSWNIHSPALLPINQSIRNQLREDIGVLADGFSCQHEQFSNASTHTTLDLSCNHWRSVREFGFDGAYHLARVVAGVDHDVLRPRNECGTVWDVRRQRLLLDDEAVVVVRFDVGRFRAHVRLDECGFGHEVARHPLGSDEVFLLHVIGRRRRPDHIIMLRPLLDSDVLVLGLSVKDGVRHESAFRVQQCPTQPAEADRQVQFESNKFQTLRHLEAVRFGRRGVLVELDGRTQQRPQ